MNANGSLAGAVEGRGMHGIEIDVVDAAYVDRGHLAAVRPFIERKCLDPAFRTKLMTNDVLVEKILSVLSYASRLRKFIHRRKSENQSALFTH